MQCDASTCDEEAKFICDRCEKGWCSGHCKVLDGGRYCPECGHEVRPADKMVCDEEGCNNLAEFECEHCQGKWCVEHCLNDKGNFCCPEGHGELERISKKE